MSEPRYRVLFLHPSPALAKHVVGYVVRRRAGSGPAPVGPAQTVSFPANVYSALSIVHRGALRDPVSGSLVTSATFSGAMTLPVRRELVDEPEITTALLKPGAAARISRVPSHELTNAWVDAQDILTPDEYLEISEHLAEQPTVARQIMVLEQMLRQRIERHALGTGADPLAAVLERGSFGLGRLKVAELARHAGLSERQLNRRVMDALGIGPKMLLRLARVQESVRLARELSGQRGHRALAQLARDAGFADVSHMTKELRLFTSQPPPQLRERLRQSNLNEWAYELPQDW
ncbi:MAG TPA: helix-turn-helix domain-containing protein [Ideonella sp.]|uniref:helix-turn-helix domain-containing protein n=1 Tax=Ideonella sp. TaxID=1929293 RepID=UPI002E335826|nr:helix-turn-helix domain-containing protein [Ideonella sp.]HEX5686488.1 helix-turn-helix domain-containing protein [Ideonella sp.]